MPALLNSVRHYATLGEITRVMKEVFGTYQEPAWL
jgi:methylmalonyl-CoA mutase N-terminal domain/subunit